MIPATHPEAHKIKPAVIMPEVKDIVTGMQEQFFQNGNAGRLFVQQKEPQSQLSLINELISDYSDRRTSFDTSYDEDMTFLASKYIISKR